MEKKKGRIKLIRSAGCSKRQPNKAAGSGTTGAYAVRVCEEGTRLTTQLDVVFSSRYGSTVTSTYAGTESAPFLSVTLSLNR